MNPPNGFSHKVVNLESRTFFLQIQKFENGYFISITEGTNKIGSMVISLATGPKPITTTIIPSRTESIFQKLIAEQISTRMRGIALVSTFTQKELEPNTAKALMSEIMEMVDND
ncbi:hypothetical protein HX860_03095 [Marine Group I thaumarchaeote]|uniref:Proteasome assembly chaperone 3 n=1 Tax=Marine Group I thaumarchaeote TaxID=2511932 RepID=A0A7K4NLZ3_9ARCH|nr:MAG: hypothetical protein DSN69_04750 [Nitrosopumilus sp. YT1]KPU81577.1 hypothetical protein JI55_00110 [Nitrosopumilus sp. PRT-SC01]NWJ20043.1 hypothetical protein [Marine Group I thaumarchaeote]NWJ29407.1 hypothetical protein [Marine Group I thaumarchaeote]NWK01680.1 hypothetical protein [Marine Group I thaumarchaeote]